MEDGRRERLILYSVGFFVAFAIVRRIDNAVPGSAEEVTARKVG